MSSRSAQVEPDSSGAATMTRHRAVLLGLVIAAALALVVPLGLGVMSGWSQPLALFAACALVAAAVTALPPSSRKRLAPLVGAFVAAAGVLPLFVRPAEDRDTPTEPRADVQYLAELVVDGPFTEELPDPLTVEGLAPVNIGDASAARKLSAAELEVALGPGDLGVLDGFFAHIEVYTSPEDAADRAAASMDLLTELPRRASNARPHRASACTATAFGRVRANGATSTPRSPSAPPRTPFCPTRPTRSTPCSATATG
jgi:hypothetical protein